ncbi:HlyC/CorC family transporter [Aquicoccus porphyridii]|uniref:HlyC/CorC family transporter n=1 Tax=Aquicoccus porphyridii TaxID=1852029 RepID=A0A5A9ZW10_9RHOB|nr:hemolysin family protein [Aquicoccus porphyridii]KAA0920825.1 HlyC/CorC family transporter [Aquicoccus porphyridii]RAI56627.1 hemolysin [Rhodobacteraceae bacterium AsT-22]
MISLFIAFLSLSIAVSFFCSLWEAVLLSISPSYMQIELNKGSRSGQILKDFKNNIDRPLAGILTLNTIAHTVGAIGVGAQATQIWADSNPLITGLIVPVAMTAAILILSEIIPKTIGATNWRMLAPFTARSLDLIVKVLAPFVWICQLVTGVFNADKEKQIFSRTDFLAMAQIGSEEGHLDQSEIQVIESILQFKAHKIRDIMTPRTVLVTAPQTMTAREFYDYQDELTYSRIPLREEATSETIVGYILKDDVLEHLIDESDDKPLSSFIRDILVVPEDYNVFQLFNDFIKRREHVALVVDSYGGTAGIATIEDVIETLLGAEIVDETDRTVDMQDKARELRKKRLARKKGQGA